MQRVPIGTQVKSLSIPRADVAVGAKARVILLDPNPAVKQCAYMTFMEGDQQRGRMVEFDQDSMIRYRVRPKPIYYFLVAHVATDLKLKPVGDDFTIEYLQLSANQYQDLVDQIDAGGGKANFNTAVLSKEKRTNEQGKDVSTVKAAFGYYELDPELKKKIDETAQNEKLMAGIWSMLDMQTSMKVREWEDFCASNGIQVLAGPASSEQALPSVRKPQLPKPQDVEPDGDDSMPVGEQAVTMDPDDGFESEADDFA